MSDVVERMDWRLHICLFEVFTDENSLSWTPPACVATPDYSEKSRYKARYATACELYDPSEWIKLRAVRGVLYEHFCEADDSKDDPDWHEDDYYCWCSGDGREGGWSEWISMTQYKKDRRRMPLWNPPTAPCFIVTYPETKDV